MGYSQSGLIGAIYDMALGHGTWDGILDIMSASLPKCAILVSGDDLKDRSNLVYSQRGLKSSSNGNYINTFAALNPWLPAQAGLAPLQVFHDDQIVPREQSYPSRFFEEWLSPQGDFGASTGVVLLRSGTRQLSLQIFYPARQQGELRDRVAELLGEASQHFARAFEISSRGRFSTGRGYLDQVVEDLPFPVFFVGEDMRIKYANFHAENLPRQNPELFNTSDGLLRTLDQQMDAALLQMVQKTVSSKRSPISVLQFSRPGTGLRYLAVARLATRTGQISQIHDVIFDPGPLVMLVMQSSADPASLPGDVLWRAFSLTESEAALAEALLSGVTLGDYAKDRQVSKQTLRNQLVGVMRKTGTRRQSELVSLLTRLSLICF